MRQSSARSALRRGTPALIAVLALLAPGTPSALASASMSGTHVTAVTHSSVTVSMKSTGRGWKYRLYASRTKSGVFFDHLHSAQYQSAASRRPTLTLGHLPYRNRPYWLRIQAFKDQYRRTGPILGVGLRPRIPTDVV